MIMKKRHFLTVIIAIIVFFALSISVLAIKGNYSMTSENRIVGSSLKISLANPSDYTASGLIDDPDDRYNDGSFCYFELADEVDASSDFIFTMYFHANANSSNVKKTTFSDPITIYDDISLDEDSVVGKGSDGTVVALPETIQETPADGVKVSMSFNIPKDTLQEEIGRAHV